jgi:hypothetical protein
MSPLPSIAMTAQTSDTIAQFVNDARLGAMLKNMSTGIPELLGAVHRATISNADLNRELLAFEIVISLTWFRMSSLDLPAESSHTNNDDSQVSDDIVAKCAKFAYALDTLSSSLPRGTATRSHFENVMNRWDEFKPPLTTLLRAFCEPTPVGACPWNDQ